MASSAPPPVPAARPRSNRRRWALPLSIALHAAVLYAIGRVPWAASDLVQPPSPQREVLWLEDWRRLQPAPEDLALDPTEPTEPAPPPAEPIALSPSETVARSPPRRAEASVAPAPPIARAPEPGDPLDEAPADASAATVATAPSTVPEVDWEKERHDAVRDVLEQRASQREYLTFSLDDVLEEPQPVDPVLPSLVVDDCVIVKGKLQRFMALMMMRCTREARGDLFALIKPGYLKAHPVCIETRPESPGSFLSDGTPVSTVKCELVAEEE
jgi:hypothetical protein